MTTAHKIRFRSALGVLALAAGSLLVGCDGSDSAGGSQADGSAAAPGSAGSGAGANGSGGAGAAGNAGTAGDAGPGGTAGEGGSDSELNTDDYTEKAFDYTDERPDDFHPLDARENVLLRREEVGIVAVSGSGTLTGVTLDDAEHTFAKLDASAAEELGGMTMFDVKAGNLDDDGNDEMVAVGTNAGSLVVRVVDSGAEAVFGAQTGFTLDDATYQHAWVELGDVDEDGRAEILISAVTTDGVELRLHDDATEGFAELEVVISEAGEEIAATIANVDDDRRPEIAVLIDRGDDLELRVLDDVGSDFAPLLTRQNEEIGLFDAPFVVSGLRIAAGEFDAEKLDGNERVGDTRDELALFVMGYYPNGDDGNPGIRAAVLDDARASFAPFPEGQRDFDQAHPDSNYRLTTDWGWQIMTTDSNGDGQDELFLLRRLPGDVNYEWTVTQVVFGSEVDRWPSATTFVLLTGEVGNGEDEVSGNSPAFMTAAAGRTDSFGRDVIVTVAHDGQVMPYRLTAQAKASGDDYDYDLSDEALPTHAAPDAASVFVAGGDWDADSLRIRYTGSKWLQLARPQPIAVLAAAPAKAGISQNYDYTSTAYGTAVSYGNSTSEEYGVTNKVTLSFEAAVPFLDFLSVGAEAELERQFTRSHTTTEVVTYGTSYAGAYPDDVIVFNGALCMRYEYEILGGGDPEHVGKLMTIDEPVDARVYKWTVGYYNEALGGEGSPIGDDVLLHTVGDPASYPTPTARNALMAGHEAAWKSKAVSVGQGTSSNSVSIDVSKESQTTDTLTIHTEYGGSFSAFVGAGYSQGWDETSVYSVTVGEQTTFQGTVGDIESTTDYADWFYSFGLFVYPTTLAGGESVHVIQYWTEGLAPKYFE